MRIFLNGLIQIFGEKEEHKLVDNNGTRVRELKL